MMVLCSFFSSFLFSHSQSAYRVAKQYIEFAKQTYRAVEDSISSLRQQTYRIAKQYIESAESVGASTARPSISHITVGARRAVSALAFYLSFNLARVRGGRFLLYGRLLPYPDSLPLEARGLLLCPERQSKQNALLCRRSE